jgi:hypothetical protein
MYHPLIGKAACNYCSKVKRDMIAAYWADGDHHYCQECWPEARRFYEDEAGRQAWKRIGNYYTAVD